jgi:hypothetical protein
MLIVGLCLGGSGCSGSQPASETLLSLSEGLVSEWTAMWNSYDLDVVDRVFLPDSSLSYFSSEREGVIQGIEAVREHHVGFDFVPGGKEQSNRLWLEDVAYDLFEGAVVVTAIWLFERAGESGPPQRGPVTFVLVMRDDGLKIAHCNFAEYGS